MREIWYEQLERVYSNILAFIILGLFSGFIVGGQSTLESCEWLNSYLKFANIEIDYGDFGSSLLSEHLAPNSLTLILIFTFILSALHRIFFGAIETKPGYKKGVTYSLVNFGSLLAIAWLGLMVGISFPALIFDGFSTAMRFWIISIYPIMFLIEVVFCLKLLYWGGLCEIPVYIEERKQWKRRTRIEGVFVLAVAMFFVTFYEQYQNFMNYIVEFLKSAL
ncbi:hypothetical protein [Vibrio atlanticus]|uniref:hypothetical protein n=1 Tax=Vibrio atlanticus TaxID=693153 RepID=UPI0022AF4B04|nr:hypothetical protein [Vibrio atlanticus]MCZ4307407.1 hypothetical protein [Vibrio atlanticus]